MMQFLLTTMALFVGFVAVIYFELPAILAYVIGASIMILSEWIGKESSNG